MGGWIQGRGRGRGDLQKPQVLRDPVLSREGWFFTPVLEEPGFSAGFLMEKRGCKPLTSRKSPGTAQEGCILSLAVLVSLFRANTHAESSEGELA